MGAGADLAGGRRWFRRRPRPSKPRVRKLRLILILSQAACAFVVVSTVFGDHDGGCGSTSREIEEPAGLLRRLRATYLYDDHWHLIGQFAPPNHEAIDSFQQISPYMRRAIVSVEDRRFWTDPGVDLRGIARAVLSDATGGSKQGASTISEQFVKNVLSEQDNRTVFEKLREAALAYHLTRRWPRQEIMRQYLNSIYFGNGAYGVESAGRPSTSGKVPAATCPRSRRSQARRRPVAIARGRHARRCSSPMKRRCSPGWSRTRARSIPCSIPRRRRDGATRSSRTCSSRTTSPRRSTSTGNASRSRPRP